MEITFRQAVAEDTSSCAELVYSAGPEIFDYIYSGKSAAIAYIAHEFRNGGGYLGHRIHQVGVYKGNVVAVAAFYGLKNCKRMERESFKNLRSFYGLFRLMPVIYRSLHTKSVMQKPRDGVVYIADVGVMPEMQSHGFGSALIHHGTELSKLKGFSHASLDVACNNPRAEELYKRLGFNFVKEKIFKGNKNANVPNVKFYIKPIGD